MPPSLTCAVLMYAIGAISETRSTELVLPTGSQVQVAATSDGFGVGLWLTAMAPPDLEHALKALDPEHVRLMAPGPKEAAAWIDFSWPVAHAQVRQVREANKRVTLRLEVGLTSPTEALGEHIFDEPLPLPASLEAHTLREADALLQTHHVAEGVLLLQRLAQAYPLRAWVLLRLGDVALLEGRINEACSLWQQAITNGRERTAARLARLRGFVAACQVTETPQWKSLLSREGRDDPVGRQSFEETLWALGFSRDTDALRTILKLESDDLIHALSASTRQSYTARIFRLGSALDVASFATQHALRGHPESFDLSMLISAAYCTLDIPNSFPAREELRRGRSWMHLSQKTRQRWRQRAEACTLMRDPTAKDWPQPKPAPETVQEPKNEPNKESLEMAPPSNANRPVDPRPDETASHPSAPNTQSLPSLSPGLVSQHLKAVEGRVATVGKLLGSSGLPTQSRGEGTLKAATGKNTTQPAQTDATAKGQSKP